MKKDVPINPREVLSYLNEMGIRNVSAEMLKQFITDLKKLIKYDLNGELEEIDEREVGSSAISDQLAKGPERLYSCSTFSSRSKCSNKNEHRKPLSCLRNSTTNVIAPKTKEHNCRSKSANFLRVPIAENRKKSDPVSLYHYYSSLWKKYKSSIPGENNWSDIRWSIREQLLQSKGPPKSLKGPQTVLTVKKNWVA